MKRLGWMAACVVVTALGWDTPAAAQDVVSFWNERALATVPVAPPAGRGATPAAIIDLAMVHVAMHDAVQAYDKRFESYAGAIAGATGSSIVAAAKAAHDILVNRFPMQSTALAADYAAFIASLTPAPSPADVAGGEFAGSAAAWNVIANRTGDGSFPPTFPQFTGGPAPGQWQPNAGTPGMVSPWGGAVRPFALDNLARCDVDPPPSLTSLEYALNYIEVKLFGSATSRFRTPRQSAIAKTFSGNFLAQYNRLVRDMAAAHLSGSSVRRLGQRARLFALANIAMSDAFICSWEAKVRFNFWRPVQAIRRGNEDGNVLTIADPSWTTYLSNGNPAAPQHPNYPDYTSGANNLTGAVTQMLALVFGSDRAPAPFGVFAASPAVPLTPGVDPDPRMYTKFSDVADDVVQARIYLGIHFRFADVAGRSQGTRVARYAFRNVLRRID